MPKSVKGFTLVELLVVISIIAILSVIGITVFSGVQKNARDAKRRGDLDAIAKALEIYKSQNNTYTPATGFPCMAGMSTSFNDWNFGVVDRGWRGSCGPNPLILVTNLGRGWINSFASSIPQDPYCKNEICNNSWSDYWFETSDGSSFTVSAKLETPPNPVMTGCHAGYNYCIKSQQ